MCLVLFLGYPLPAAHWSQEPEPNGLRSPFSSNSSGIRQTNILSLSNIKPISFSSMFSTRCFTYYILFLDISFLKLLGAFIILMTVLVIMYNMHQFSAFYENIYVTFLYSSDSICHINALLRNLPYSTHKYAYFLMTRNNLNCQTSKNKFHYQIKQYLTSLSLFQSD